MGKAVGFHDIAGKKRKFLKALSESGNVTKSAKACGAARPSLYQWRDADEAFAAAWHDALDAFADTLEEELRDLGQRSNNPTAYIFLLKGLRPEKYRETTQHAVAAKVINEHSGPGGGPIPIRFFDAGAVLAAITAGSGEDRGGALDE